jgi:hypothetical protein
VLAQPNLVMVAAPRRLRTTALLVLAAIALAAASLLVSDALRFDAHGWLRWGRELARGDGTFDTSGYPSWKPPPLLATVPLAFAGPTAPALWLLGVRTAGILALGVLGLLTARQAGVLGGATAVVLLALAPGWWATLLGGGIEPVVVALGCAAVAAHRAHRPGLALALLAGMALGREEALLLLAAYGVVLCRGDRRRWAARVGLAIATVAAAWLGGDWIGSGNPFHGGDLARTAERAPFHLGTVRLVAVLLVVPPACVLWVAGVAAARRKSDRAVLVIAVAGVVWTLLDLGLVAVGYPLPARFLLPAAATAAATAGVGAHTLHTRSR